MQMLCRLRAISGSVVVAIAIVLALLRITISVERPRPTSLATGLYCVAFTSFQISLYLARRGTFCQK